MAAGGLLLPGYENVFEDIFIGEDSGDEFEGFVEEDIEEREEYEGDNENVGDILANAAWSDGDRIEPPDIPFTSQHLSGRTIFFYN